MVREKVNKSKSQREKRDEGEEMRSNQLASVTVDHAHDGHPVTAVAVAWYLIQKTQSTLSQLTSQER